MKLSSFLWMIIVIAADLAMHTSQHTSWNRHACQDYWATLYTYPAV